MTKDIEAIKQRKTWISEESIQEVHQFIYKSKEEI